VQIKLISIYVDDQDLEQGQPPTKVAGSTIAMLKDTRGNLIQIVALDRWT
jgi:hypothetical protein